MKRIIRTFLCLAFISLVTCTDSSGPDNVQMPLDDEPVTFNIKITDKNVKSYQLITLTIPEKIVLSKETYKAKFGDSEVTLMRQEDHDLIFMAPDFATGEYDFSLNIGDKTSSLKFKLDQTEDFENVDQVIDDNLIKEVKQAYEEANSANSQLDNETKIIIDFGNEFYEKALSALENLTIIEKQVLAKYLVVNNIEDDLNKTSMANSAAANVCPDLDKNLQTLINQRLKIAEKIASLGLLVKISIKFGHLGKVFAVAVLIKGAHIIYKINGVNKTIASIIDCIFIPISNELEAINTNVNKLQLSKSTSLHDFCSDESRRFKVKSLGRKIQKSDSNSPNKDFAQAASAIEESFAILNEIKSTIDNAISKLGNVIGITSNKLTANNGLTTSEGEFPIEIDLKNLTLTDLPANVTSSIKPAGNQIVEIIFNSDDNQETSFKASLLYNDNGNSFKDEFEVKLGTNCTVEDIDGNVYEVVYVGGKQWIAENLKVLRYNTGTPITHVTSDLTKADNSYTYYNYGGGNAPMYMFFGGNADKLCPKGWSIPTIADWEGLDQNDITNKLNVKLGGVGHPELPSTPTSKNNFTGIGEKAVFWALGGQPGWIQSTIEISSESVATRSGLHTFGYASCRCVKDD